MNIKVEFLSLPLITKAIGSKSISLNIPGSTVDDLLRELANKYGPKVDEFLFDESGKLDNSLKMLLNKKEWIYSNQTNKSLKEDDQLTIMLLAGGG